MPGQLEPVGDGELRRSLPVEPSFSPPEEEELSPATTEDLALFLDTGPAPTNPLEDLTLAHRMLTEAGVEHTPSVAERLYLDALRWLALAQANGHTRGCQDQLCTAARRKVAAYLREI